MEEFNLLPDSENTSLTFNLYTTKMRSEIHILAFSVVLSVELSKVWMQQDQVDLFQVMIV